MCVGVLVALIIIIMDYSSQEVSSLEKGEVKGLNKEVWNGVKTPHNVSSSIMRKKSDPVLVSTVRFQMLRHFLTNMQEVILGTKLAVLFPAIPLAIAADFYKFGRVSFLLHAII